VISDKFNSNGSTSSNSKGYTKRRSTKREDGFVVIKNKDKSIPNCSLCNLPSRFAIAMTDKLGFIQKNDII